MKGKYETALEETMKEEQLEYNGNHEMALTSAGVLDFISERLPNLPLREALVVLDDAKKLLMQLKGI